MKKPLRVAKRSLNGFIHTLFLHLILVFHFRFKPSKVSLGVDALGQIPYDMSHYPVYGRDASWVRARIISGWLPIGKATRNGKLITDVKEMDSRKGRMSYYISPKLLYEDTGYVWTGSRE